MAKILYFADLADHLGSVAEEVTLPEAVKEVRSLLQWLHICGDAWDSVLTEDNVRVTVDRQFAIAETSLNDKSEIVIFLCGADARFL